ncbi:MAG: hypothetical protein IT175_11950 [Acidobacteria bacterium]|nr:hypothetical protein [Acidobacteriota bacterium]
MIVRFATLCAALAISGLTGFAQTPAPTPLVLERHAVVTVPVGRSEITTIELPSPPSEVVASGSDAFAFAVSETTLSIRTVSPDAASSGADLFISFDDRTYSLDVRMDTRAGGRQFVAREADGTPGQGRVVSASGAAVGRTGTAAAVIFVEASSLRLPPLVVARGRLTRIELPREPVNLLLTDPDSFALDLRGNDLYIGPAPGAPADGCRLQILLDGGTTLDFDLQVRQGGSHHRAVIVRSGQLPERRILRRTP